MHQRVLTWSSRLLRNRRALLGRRWPGGAGGRRFDAPSKRHRTDQQLTVGRVEGLAQHPAAPPSASARLAAVPLGTYGIEQVVANLVQLQDVLLQETTIENSLEENRELDLLECPNSKYLKWFHKKMYVTMKAKELF